MDLLRTAVVDIATLVATCRALKVRADEDDRELRRKLRQRLRRDLRRGTITYVDTLARTRRAAVDETLLTKCRVAAEGQMPRALACADLLCRVMSSEAGALDGMAAMRQDLWRLAHLVTRLGHALNQLRAAGSTAEAAAATEAARRLRRRLRKALTAYARTALRGKAPIAEALAEARLAALAEIGARGAAAADALADREGGTGGAAGVLRDAISRPLWDLLLDWRPAVTRRD